MHCLQSSRLYPILGSGLGTKAFWLFTFVFFNPILSLLYILCAVGPIAHNWKKNRFASGNKLENAEKVPMRNKYILAVVYSVICINLILFEIQRTAAEIQPVTALNKAEGTDVVKKTHLKSGMNIGFIDAKNKIQTISSNPSKDEDKVSFSRIVLICKSERYFLEQISQNIQNSLFKLPYVETVTCYMNNALPDPNTEKADIFISLKISELKEDKFLLTREMNVKINCAASNSISEALSESSRNVATDSIDSFTIKSQLHHTSKTISIECPGTEYEHEVENISNVLTDAFKTQFKNLLENREESSEVLYGTYTGQSL
ncbi:MAG: hypothetical protein JXA96_08560 [Sedimentisphaerales bacterium]|nr:hypothetical protein [Sedimentisphaerales bacterium]